MKLATSSPSSLPSSVHLCSDKIEPDGHDFPHQESIVHPTYDQAFSATGPNVVDMGHSDVELWVNNTVFKTHAHLLVKFARLEELINENSLSNTGTRLIRLHRGERCAEDMTNMFKILYASVITGPFEFETAVLISALRIASVYEYAALRMFAVERLEKADLDPIHRIELAREFKLTSWNGPAYDELYKRDEALTDNEAQILGVLAFAEVTRRREEEKMRKGKQVGKQEYKEALEREQAEIRERDEKDGRETRWRQVEAREREGDARNGREIMTRAEAEETLCTCREALDQKRRVEKETIERSEKEREGGIKRMREATEQAEREKEEKEKRAKKEREERAKRMREAIEREEREKEEKEKRIKKEQQARIKRMQEAIEQAEREKEEKEKRIKKEQEARIKRIQQAIEQAEREKEEKERRAKKQREERAKRMREAIEKGEREKEEKERRAKKEQEERIKRTRLAIEQQGGE